jgi:hypothetical protein
MAKDPRFNFYPDNWLGGTEGFTLEQEGAYLALIIMQSKIGRFTENQALDKLMQKTRGNTAVCTELWKFLIPKFESAGNLYWSDRLEKEIEKSNRHSKLQSERISARWEKEKDNSGNTAVIPVYGNGIGIEDKIKSAFDEIYLNQEKTKWPRVDFQFEYDSFCNKIRGSPGSYEKHDAGGLRLAFQSQLRFAKERKKPPPKPKYVV